MLSNGTNIPKFHHLANPINRSKKWLNVFIKSDSALKKVPKAAKTCKAKEEKLVLRHKNLLFVFRFVNLRLIFRFARIRFLFLENRICA